MQTRGYINLRYENQKAFRYRLVNLHTEFYFLMVIYGIFKVSRRGMKNEKQIF